MAPKTSLSVQSVQSVHCPPCKCEKQNLPVVSYERVTTYYPLYNCCVAHFKHMHFHNIIANQFHPYINCKWCQFTSIKQFIYLSRLNYILQSALKVHTVQDIRTEVFSTNENHTIDKVLTSKLLP